MDSFSRHLDSWIAGPRTHETTEDVECEYCGETWTVHATVEYGVAYPDETMLETIDQHRAACAQSEETK